MAARPECGGTPVFARTRAFVACLTTTFVQMAQTMRLLTNYLSSRPYKAIAAEANDITQHSPSWIIHDKEGNVVFRYLGHCMDGQLRDVLLPYLMGVEKPSTTALRREVWLWSDKQSQSRC